MENNKIKVACFGEVLWDIFPGQERRMGGAPFNVAYHLAKMGVDVHMISSVGADVLGTALLEQVKLGQVSTSGVQVHERYPTSTVIANIDENNEAHYDIVEQVAWDYIVSLPTDVEALAATDAFVFGSLAARHEKSRNTLFELLEASSYNVFDINLRPPHYNVAIIKELLYKTQLAKFNNAELQLVLDFLGKNYDDEHDKINFVRDTFGICEIIVSKGSKGALYVHGDNFHLYPSVKVNVKDTVGSGDSFLAGFLAKRLDKGAFIQDIMHQAVALGAFVTSHEGACPTYSLADFVAFKETHPVKAMDYFGAVPKSGY